MEWFGSGVYLWYNSHVKVFVFCDCRFHQSCAIRTRKTADLEVVVLNVYQADASLLIAPHQDVANYAVTRFVVGRFTNELVTFRLASDASMFAYLLFIYGQTVVNNHTCCKYLTEYLLSQALFTGRQVGISWMRHGSFPWFGDLLVREFLCSGFWINIRSRWSVARFSGTDFCYLFCLIMFSLAKILVYTNILWISPIYTRCYFIGAWCSQRFCSAKLKTIQKYIPLRLLAFHDLTTENIAEIV